MATKCTKFVFGRGSAPNPAGGTHDTPPDPLVGWGGEHPLPIPLPSAPRFSLITPSGASLPAFRHFFFHMQFNHWPQPKSMLVHFSVKIWHLVATVLMIFLRIN